MVPEKAERFEHDDTVALALLVRGFKLLPDTYIYRCACTYRYMHAIEYSLLSYDFSPLS